MLRIEASLNPPSRSVLDCKTCCGPKLLDWNLEILVTNRGSQTVTLRSGFDLELPSGTRRIAAVLPAGEQSLAPGEVKAFYCQVDENQWDQARAIHFVDTEGGRHSHHRLEPRSRLC